MTGTPATGSSLRASSAARLEPGPASTFDLTLLELVRAGATDSQLEDEGFSHFEVCAVRALEKRAVPNHRPAGNSALEATRKRPARSD